jgi:hypothetical protein
MSHAAKKEEETTGPTARNTVSNCLADSARTTASTLSKNTPHGLRSMGRVASFHRKNHLQDSPNISFSPIFFLAVLLSIVTLHTLFPHDLSRCVADRGPPLPILKAIIRLVGFLPQLPQRFFFEPIKG